MFIKAEASRISPALTVSPLMAIFSFGWTSFSSFSFFLHEQNWYLSYLIFYVNSIVLSVMTSTFLISDWRACDCCCTIWNKVTTIVSLNPLPSGEKLVIWFIIELFKGWFGWLCCWFGSDPYSYSSISPNLLKPLFIFLLKKLILAYMTTSLIFINFLFAFFNLLYFWFLGLGNSLQDYISNFLEGC